jgi:hypothetical protein
LIRNEDPTLSPSEKFVVKGFAQIEFWPFSNLVGDEPDFSNTGAFKTADLCAIDRYPSSP